MKKSYLKQKLKFFNSLNLKKLNFIFKKNLTKEAKVEPKQIIYTAERTKINSDNFGSQKSDKKWDMENLAEELFLDQSIERHSTCDLELDSCAADIMNFDMDKDGYMLNPGMSALWDEEKKRRELQNIDIPLETIDTEERTNILKVENEIEFKKRLIMLLETSY
ncbi:DNA polymerase zeta catalytic subunit [Brachionus plicatilis]|uniref:DNA polymerase zeta catalytic subunit n=1 Tax=Brachionus plicatilis TaxID=10195 RepID=A0A3M7R8S3_BRAPC|nr:DNA polymerase zeta catalytic subunit [Brachionus plicatilis]